jgi:hypothetical protein
MGKAARLNGSSFSSLGKTSVLRTSSTSPYQGVFDPLFIQKFLLQPERFVVKIQKRIFLADHILRGE